VRDGNRRDPDTAQNHRQLLEQSLAQRTIQRAQRLVQKQEPRLRRETASQSNPLTLTTGEVYDASVGKLLQPHQREHLRDLILNNVLGTPHHPQSKGHVFRDGPMGKECVLLKHQHHPTRMGRHPR